MALGVIAATIGVGSAAGPLLGGVLSELMGWRSIFFVTASVALTIPFTIKALPKFEQRSAGSLDLIGGIGLGLMVAGILLVPTEGSRSGWTSDWVIVGAVMAAVGVGTLVARQAFASSPFIHRELLRNAKYLALAGMSFSVMAANLAPLIGLPVLLAFSHGLSSLEIGLVMVPGAALSAAGGLLSGRLTDRSGAKIPVRIGSMVMLVAHGNAGGAVWPVCILWVFAVDHRDIRRADGSRIWVRKHAIGRHHFTVGQRGDAGFGPKHELDVVLPGRKHRYRPFVRVFDDQRPG